MTARDELFDLGKTKIDETPPSLQQDMIEALRLAAISILVLLLALSYLAASSARLLPSPALKKR